MHLNNFPSIKVVSIQTEELFSVLSRKVLFEARWGFSKGNLSDDEYKKIIDNKAIPALEKIIAQEKEKPIIEGKAVYGFFQTMGQGDKIYVSPNSSFIKENCILFDFPRQKKEPNLCIADFVKGKNTIVAFFVVTIGERIIEVEKKLFEENSYYDYHLLHGLGAELADCAAVCIHKRITKELFPEINNNKILGCRYSFGYPSCPELSNQQKLFELLDPSRIGLTLTKSYQMVPELSVSGFIIFDDKARYFVP